MLATTGGIACTGFKHTRLVRNGRPREALQQRTSASLEALPPQRMFFGTLLVASSAHPTSNFSKPAVCLSLLLARSVCLQVGPEACHGCRCGDVARRAALRDLHV